MITTGIIILQINHISVGVSKKFVKQKINKLTILLSNHVKNCVNRITNSAKKYSISNTQENSQNQCIR